MLILQCQKMDWLNLNISFREKVYLKSFGELTSIKMFSRSKNDITFYSLDEIFSKSEI